MPNSIGVEGVPAGRPENMGWTKHMFIDIHTHVTNRPTTRRPDGSTYTTPGELLAMLDSLGIARAVLLPVMSPEGNHHPVTTEEVLEIAAAFPERFVPFCNIDPRQIGNSPDVDFRDHLRYYRQAGCRGLGEVTANLSFDDPRVLNLFSQCEEMGFPVLFHVGPCFGGCYGLVDEAGLPRLEQCLARFPRLAFIGHSQPFWAEISGDADNANRGGYPQGPVTPGRVVDLMRRYTNLYGDLSAYSGYNAITRDPAFGLAFLHEFQDRLLFGTDICAPHNRPRQAEYLRKCLDEGHLSCEAFEKIAWRNAACLLGLDT